MASEISLTSKVKQATLDPGNLLVDTVGEFKHRSHGFLRATINLEENAFESTTLVRGLVPRTSHNRCGAEELAQRE